MDLYTLRNKLENSLLENGKTSSFKRNNDSRRYKAYLNNGFISVCYATGKGEKETITWDTFLHIWLENIGG